MKTLFPRVLQPGVFMSEEVPFPRAKELHNG